MTTNQIKLREVKEVERHNRVTEQLTSESNTYTREHYERADRASLIQAYAAQSQAAAAHRNAAVNEINAMTSRYNAETNRMAAEAQISYNAGMLQVARQNAATNQFAAATAAKKVQIEKASQELKEAQFEWTKSLDEQYLNLDRYKANLEGLKLKENVRQFDLGYTLDLEKFKVDKSVKQSEKAKNYSSALKNVSDAVLNVFRIKFPGSGAMGGTYYPGDGYYGIKY